MRFLIRSLIGRYPFTYRLAQNLKRSRLHLLVRPDTDIVIEGYPRCANTFAVIAFLLAQKRPIKIAHHSHVPAQVINAIRWGIPTIVLIRNPEEAIPSLLVRQPKLSAKQAVRDYIRFYSTIRPFHSAFVLATFKQVIKRFDKIIENVNIRFGTDFCCFAHTKENLDKVYSIIDELDKKDTGKSCVTETTIARPSKDRIMLKAEKSRELKKPEISYLFGQARLLYNEMLNEF